jgi:hypothetical protein
MRSLMRSPAARFGSVADLADELAPYGPRRSVRDAVRGVLAAGATRWRSSTLRVRNLVRQRKW